jgi:hypothetical protein
LAENLIDMKKNYLIFLICLIGSSCFAQTGVVNYQGNNFVWSQNTSGMLFHNSATLDPGLEVPALSGIYSIYTHNLVFGGVGLSGSLHSFYQLYCQSPNTEVCENLHGPLKIGGEINSAVDVEEYNRFWFVTRAQVDLHIAYFECANNPDCDENVDFPNYEVPEDIVLWPAHGDVDLGYAEYLAPFYDLNGDGQYDALDGDYPNFCGDFMSYQIFNDVGTQETINLQENAGLEIHTQVYGYNSIEAALSNTLFVRHRVINRSDETYTDSYLGNFTDFDLGNPGDDYIGTDVERGMYYVYNGDPVDNNSSGSLGYGDDLPAVGIKYLAGPFMDNDGIDNLFEESETYGHIGPGWGDDIIDNERYALSSTLVTSSGGPSETDLPELPIHMYNNLRSIWKNGLPMSFGGNGYDEGCTDCLDARYAFPGDTDPIHLGTDGIDPNYGGPEGWTEEAEEFPPGDRRVIAGSGPFTFEPGDTETLDYAVIFARESQDEDLTVIETLQQYADEIVGMQCGEIPDVTVGILNAPSELKFKVFPNPATDMLNIQLPRTFQRIRVEVLDMQSRIIYSRDLSQTSRGTLSLDVAKGQYILRVIADGEVGVSKLTKM